MKTDVQISRLPWAVVVTGWIFLGAGLAFAGGSGRCYTAEIPSRVVMPDGTTHPPGALRICVTRKYSPVEALHHTALEGEPIGLFRSRMSEGEDLDEYRQPFFVLSKRADGALTLQGFAHPHPGGMKTYRMGPVEEITTTWQLARELGREGSPVILLAAR